MDASPIPCDIERLRRFCTEHGVRRVRIYGSATRPDFDLTRSDVDVLLDFLPGRTPGFAFFTLSDELAAVFGRRVDVNTEEMLSEHFRDEVLRQARVIYDAA